MWSLLTPLLGNSAARILGTAGPPTLEAPRFALRLSYVESSGASRGCAPVIGLFRGVAAPERSKQTCCADHATRRGAHPNAPDPIPAPCEKVARRLQGGKLRQGASLSPPGRGTSRTAPAPCAEANQPRWNIPPDATNRPATQGDLPAGMRPSERANAPGAIPRVRRPDLSAPAHRDAFRPATCTTPGSLRQPPPDQMVPGGAVAPVGRQWGTNKR